MVFFIKVIFQIINWFRKKPVWGFVLAMVLVSLFYRYQDIIPLRPRPMHNWRQTDCLSYALNYYQNGLKFSEPAVHWAGLTGDGKAVSEFPIMYYTVAILWKIFGTHEFIYRLLTLLIAFLGLYYLFKTVQEILSSSFWAFFISLGLFSSPVFANYAISFIANSPAFSISLVGWYFIWRFYRFRRSKLFWVASALFLLAGLLKVTACIGYAALSVLFIMEVIGICKFGGDEKLFRKPWQYAANIIIVWVSLIAWYKYAQYYGSIHNNIFLKSIFPIWGFSGEEIKEIWDRFWMSMLPRYFNRIWIFIDLAILLVIIMFSKKVNKLLLWLTIWVAIGVIAYLLLWYGALAVHDYYLLNPLLFIILPPIALLLMLKKNYPGIFQSALLKIIVTVCLLLNIYYCAVHMRVSYNNKGLWFSKSLVMNERQIGFWNWQHDHYKKYWLSFETVTPYLRSLGIKRTDKVVSIPDESYNISLYMMDQKGYNDRSIMYLNEEDPIARFIFEGAKYMLISDSSVYERQYILPYLRNKIGSYENIDIYDLREL